jgi:hypothetical protein
MAVDLIGWKTLGVRVLFDAAIINGLCKISVSSPAAVATNSKRNGNPPEKDRVLSRS